jgi:hypothetical protein
MHQQHTKIRSYTIGAPQVKSHRSSNMHTMNQLKSCGGANTKRMHSKRTHPQKIFSPRQENGVLLQRFYNRTLKQMNW